MSSYRFQPVGSGPFGPVGLPSHTTKESAVQHAIRLLTEGMNFTAVNIVRRPDGADCGYVRLGGLDGKTPVYLEMKPQRQ